jgi:hypothetical protein
MLKSLLLLSRATSWAASWRPAKKAEYAGWYLGLAGLLGVLAFESHELLRHVRL